MTCTDRAMWSQAITGVLEPRKYVSFPSVREGERYDHESRKGIL